MTKQTKKELFPKYKIVFLGDTAVGKTTLITKYVFANVTRDYHPTIGIDFFAQKTEIGGKKVDLQLWDTAGQERFRSLIPNYTRDSFMAVVLFDHTRRETFDNVDSWIEKFVLKNNEKEAVKIVLVGNKADLKEKKLREKKPEESPGFTAAPKEPLLEETPVLAFPSQDEIEAKANKYHAAYANTCSLTDDGISKLVQIIEKTIELSAEPEPKKDAFSLEAHPTKRCACM